MDNDNKNNLKESLFSINEKYLLINNILKTNQKTSDGHIILLKNKKKIPFLKFILKLLIILTVEII